MRGIYEKGFNGNNAAISKKAAVNIYQKFSIAFALMSVIPLLALFYLITGELGSVNVLIGNIGLILALALLISLLGLVELRKAYQENLVDRREVYRSAKMSSLGRLIAEVAHEVNNPLQAILGRARLSLLEGGHDRATEQNLRIIIDECNKAKEVTHKLLMFSAPRKNTVKKTDVNETVETAVKVFRNEFHREDIKILERYSKKLPELMMDKYEICDVVVHLLKNSVDAMPAGGIIKVDTRKENGYVRIDVADTGEGIPEEDIEKLFDPFFTSKGGGKGVGLSVCYGIVKAHDGDLKYSSITGRGTMASLFLPLRG
ncbi:MAG: hypothetical protein GF409_02930 [Candidatus Omnitrophica bacterium]|nr:hypothetical protein [Candidatus Omnitrophota bacterium]